MRYGKNEKTKLSCRDARGLRASMARPDADLPLRALFDEHIEGCSRCARDYRLTRLTRAVLDNAAAAEPVRPDTDFFVALRARIERGPAVGANARLDSADDGWAAVLMLTTRQLIPVMALLLLIIIGATFFWGNSPAAPGQVATVPRERVLFSDMYDYPEPTSDDVLQTLVMLEEK
ncbi:MAG TPA: hypothetical protein VJQ56_15550 [Blastocatellia bacterium]|nr:hypothetical protein [Blastocatellia bacterium]